MKIKNEVTENKLGFYNQTSHNAFLGMIERESVRVNRILEIYNKLEIGEFEQENLFYLLENNSSHFAKLYQSKISEMVDKIAIPSVLKIKLLNDSKNAHLPELISLLDNSRNHSLMRGFVPGIGGMKSYDILPEYFEFVEGRTAPAKDLEEKTKKFFALIIDTPEKSQALNLFNEIAEKLNLFSDLLETTGLYTSSNNPIIEKSYLFRFNHQEGKYKPNLEAFL